jgi:hypothetical protein
MPGEIHIYFEGHRLLKPGFNKFFSELRERAEANGCRFRPISCGSRDNACRDFSIAQANRDSWNLLPIDAEGPIDNSTIAELKKRHHWKQLQMRSVFWMVEMMESWFHADVGALRTFYGGDLKETALKANQRVEQIPKRDLIRGLSDATSGTGKGNYFDHKTDHGPKLLAMIKPELVRRAAPNCERLFGAVLARLE